MIKARAALLSDVSVGLSMAEVELPERQAGQALIEVRAASINPIDLAMANGKSYVGQPSLPYVPGIEGVGVVLEGDALPAGTLIRFESTLGTKVGALATKTVVDERTAIILPNEAPVALAAALGVAGWAGWMTVEWRAQLVKGETVLILGATGAVGQIAVQAARILGAGRIVAAGRNAGVLEKARLLGAHEVVVLDGREAPALAAAFGAAAGRPIEVVIDMLWGEPALAGLMAIAPRGRLVNLGQSAGVTATLPSGALRGKMVSMLGYTNFLVPFEARKAAFMRMLEHAMSGELVMAHEVMPLEKANEGWKAQANSPSQKLVFVGA